MISELKSQWLELSSKYFEDELITEIYCKEIIEQYASKKRYYHNLSHLQNMFKQLDKFESEIIDLDALKFAIWYHDIIYKSTKKDNEEESAILAKKRLKSSYFDEKRIKKVEKLIISTKKHQLILTKNDDNAYLLDLDLSILGTDWNTYKNYIQNIRKEYKIYPKFMYNPGRKKVLNHFLERETLFFTDAFQIKYEKRARENLKKEIKLL
ncbi:hypothetical protein [Winogradskyella sp. PG-2]|uniref:HD domain-containing protein n=1 Tax=Winogradskyella sp. PG-2 TaxID=754409 RepID=UPI000458868D|nr:hypothetical protein [Winogradskyella sp. PG-2]BAO75362.1 hypothetical protein WPG_1132 [Winogradskyella sp. PG-2]